MIRAVIVDDERPSLNIMEKLLAESGMAKVTGKFTRAADALAFIKENKADAVFLDIEMPDMDGIELANRMLDMQERLAVVFVTAYSQYAVEAFRLNALDYLLKPVTNEILKETLCRIIEEKGIAANTAGIQIRMLGRFSVRAGLEAVKFRTEKAEELLAFLIDKRGGFVSRREILDSLWEDFEGDRALMHFNTTLHYVKKALFKYGINLFPSLTYERGGYNFDLKGMDCDYLKFCSFIDSTKAPGKENIIEFEKTAELYKGVYLYGWEHDWAERKRMLLEEKYISMLLGLGEYYIGTGSYLKASEWLKAGLLHEPMHRELNYRLIEALQLANEHALAAKYYDRYTNRLKRKLGQEPDNAFRKLLR